MSVKVSWSRKSRFFSKRLYGVLFATEEGKVHQEYVNILFWISGELNGRVVTWASYQNCYMLQTQNVSCKYTPVQKMPSRPRLLTQSDGFLMFTVHVELTIIYFFHLWRTKCCENTVINISALLSKQIHFYQQKWRRK